VAAVGGLMFGYDWVVISGADIFYEAYFRLTSAADIGWAKGCALLGCLVGSLVAGALSDRFGRKRLLLLSALLFAVSSLATGLAPTFAQFVFWRIIGGVAIGIASNVSPLYLAEVAPAASRGKLVSLYQLNIVVGIVLAQVANWLVAKPVAADATALDLLRSWNGQVGWRWMFGLVAAPAALFLAGLVYVPESPRWLLKNGQRVRAKAVLARLGGERFAAQSVAEIESTLESEDRHGSVRELWRPGVRRMVGFGMLLALLVQWCGINVVFYYTKDVFAAAGFNVSAILLNIIIVGLTNLVFTVVALHTVDRLGRRRLTLAGWSGLAVLFVALGCCFHANVTGAAVVLLVVAAIGWYASTLAPTCWVTLAEIFPNRIRGAAMAAAVFALWVGNFTLTCLFPLLLARFGAAGTFWAFAGICVGGFVLMNAHLPETKGKTLEEIERELAGKAEGFKG
jgi:sugar porter (SP) family MFS transporter